MAARTSSGESVRATAKEAPGEIAALPFEQALERLEGVVDRLESGDLPLEEALARFEEGVHLTQRCAAQLEVARQRIELLVESGPSLLTRPFFAEEADAELEDDFASGDDEAPE